MRVDYLRRRAKQAFVLLMPLTVLAQMNFTTGKQAPDEGREEDTGKARFESSDEMIVFAQEYFASDFPNPERLGCPVSGTLGALARAGKQPGAELRAHLFGCSECFQEFRTALLAHANPPPIVSWRDKLRGAFTLRPAPVVAGALSLLLLVFAGIYLRQTFRETTAPGVVGDEPARVKASPEDDATNSSTAPATPEASPTHAAQQARPANLPLPGPTPPRRRPPPPLSPRENRRELLVINTIKIDLEGYTALRDADNVVGREEIAIKLPRSLIRLVLALPEGSVKGSYSLSIVDSSGKVLVVTKAHSTDGKTLTATLNARKLTPQKYRLRLSREGESPGHYTVTVDGSVRVIP
jgi:hypothetical protein